LVYFRLISHNYFYGILFLLLLSNRDKNAPINFCVLWGISMKTAMRIVFVLMFLSLVSQFLFAQGTDLGTIRGTVTDSTGAVIPHASVSIVDLHTNATRATTTNGQGDFQAFGIAAGNYKVVISMSGMQTVQVTGIVIRGSDTVAADAVLKPATSQQSIEVTSAAPIVDTEDQTVSQSISSVAVVDLPRDSRNVYSFLYLNPNIVQGPTDGQFKFVGSQSYGANFTIDGQRSNGGIFGEPSHTQPSLEAVDAINVLSNDFSAEYAGIANIRVTTKRGGANYHGSIFYNNSNSALAAWKLQDKIGKAGFAPTPFQSSYPTPYFNINDAGGSFGGPVPGLKKTWFFAAYEKNWTVTPVSVQNSNLPHPTLSAGDFSLVPDNNKPLVPAGIGLTPQEQAADTVGGLGQRFITIPSRLLNPVVQKLIGTYFPQIGISAPIDSNGRVPDYATLLSGSQSRHEGTLRIDHEFNDNNRVYGTYQASELTEADTNVQSPFTGLGLTQNYRRNNLISGSYTRIFSPTIINELRGGFNYEKLRRNSNTTLRSFLSSVGFDDSDITAYGDVVGASQLDTTGHPAISFSNRFVTFQNGGRNTNRPSDQDLATFGDTLTWTIHKHNLKMGADFVRNYAIDGFAFNRGNPRGLMTYTGAGTTPYADWLLGQAPFSVSYIAEPRPAMTVHNWESGFFVQDDWKVSNRLTVNMGLRYELITPFTDANDLMVNFDPSFVGTGGQKGRFIIPSEKTLDFLDTRIIGLGVVTADKSGLGVGKGLVRTDKNNLAPRFGMAFRLTDKSVIRGGYGFYFPTSAAQGIRDPLATNSFNQTLQKRIDPNDAANVLSPWPGFSHGFSPFTGGAVITGFGGLPSINAVPVGLQQPRIQQYNATYEHELFTDSSIRLSYIGSTLSGLIAGADLNEIQPSDTPFGTTLGVDAEAPALPTDACDPFNNGDCGYSTADLGRQPFPGLGDFLESFGNRGHGRMNSFLAEFTKRYTHGLLLDFSYSYVDQKSTGLDTGNSSLGGTIYNPFEPDHDYGQEGYVSHNRFVAYGVFDLPVGHGKRIGSGMSGWKEAVLGGWQTTFNMFAKSGTGFTPFWVCDDCGPVSPGNVGVGSVDAVGDFNTTSYRPVVVGNPNHKVGGAIWDANAFALMPLGADLFSNPNIATRNMLHGPGTWGANLGIHKNFQIGERVIASLGADIDNLFNHALFSPDQDNGGGGGLFAQLGEFSLGVDPTTKQINIADLAPNLDFGKLLNSFSQEGVDSRRTVRLRLRITF
jgi:hypothetical protein